MKNRSSHFWLFALAIVVILNSCTPQRRLERLVRKHPELVKVDTLTIHDTVQVTIPSIRIDTFATVAQLRDTVYFTKDFMHLKVWEHNDTVYVDANTDTIYKTVYRTLKVPYNKIQVQKKNIFWRELIAGILLLTYFGRLIYYAFFYKEKNDSD